MRTTGLQAYGLMRKTGCLADRTTNTYCYILATQNRNPADIYFYQLPLGVDLPRSTTPTCSACTKSMLALYAGALGNSTQLATLGDGLKETYPAALELAQGKCGADYAANVTASSGVLPVSGPTLRLLGVVGAVLAAGISMV